MILRLTYDEPIGSTQVPRAPRLRQQAVTGMLAPRSTRILMVRALAAERDACNRLFVNVPAIVLVVVAHVNTMSVVPNLAERASMIANHFQKTVYVRFNGCRREPLEGSTSHVAWPSGAIIFRSRQAGWENAQNGTDGEVFLWHHKVMASSAGPDSQIMQPRGGMGCISPSI